LALDEQRRLFQLLLPERPGHGESACREGRAGVMGLRLIGRSGSGQILEAHPSLLLRQEGASSWGAFRYQPVLARQGHHITREHRLVLALWGRLLAERQGAAVNQGLVLGGAGSRRPETVNLAGSLGSQLDGSLSRLAVDLERSELPPLVSDRKKCTLCSWRNLCDAEARQEGHLSEVSGIGGKRRELLQEVGINRLADLAAQFIATPPSTVLSVNSFEDAVARGVSICAPAGSAALALTQAAYPSLKLVPVGNNDYVTGVNTGQCAGFVAGTSNIRAALIKEALNPTCNLVRTNSVAAYAPYDWSYYSADYDTKCTRFLAARLATVIQQLVQEDFPALSLERQYSALADVSCPVRGLLGTVMLVFSCCLYPVCCFVA
jgi:predicted RecB family nuclease